MYNLTLKLNNGRKKFQIKDLFVQNLLLVCDFEAQIITPFSKIFDHPPSSASLVLALMKRNLSESFKNGAKGPLLEILEDLRSIVA